MCVCVSHSAVSHSSRPYGPHHCQTFLPFTTFRSLLKLMSIESVVSNSEMPWTVACQAPLSMGFSRQEYWSGLLCLPPRDLPNPGIEHASLSPALVGKFFATSTTWEAQNESGAELRVLLPIENLRISYNSVLHRGP